MGIQKYRCEQCNHWFYMHTATSNWKDPHEDERKAMALDQGGIHQGDYNSRFCSKSCAQAWEQAHPGKSSQTVGERAAMGCLMAPFKLAWWLTKFSWKATKWMGRITWKVMTNKWVVTIFTVGIAWMAWKVLDKIYSKK